MKRANKMKNKILILMLLFAVSSCKSKPDQSTPVSDLAAKNDTSKLSKTVMGISAENKSNTSWVDDLKDLRQALYSKDVAKLKTYFSFPVGDDNWGYPVEFTADELKERKAKYKKSTLTEEQRKTHITTLLTYMNDHKPYLNPNISPQDIADNIKINKHHLSEILNLNFGKNFNGFINLYRIEEAKKLLTDNHNNITMLAIAYDSGFNSKSSFNRAFKEITGNTPSEYKKNMSHPIG